MSDAALTPPVEPRMRPRLQHPGRVPCTMLQFLLVLCLVVGFVLLVRYSDRARSVPVRGQIRVVEAIFGLGLLGILARRVLPEQSKVRVAQLIPPWLSRPVMLAASVGLCLSVPLAAWLGHVAGYSKIGGVLPWSDASGYHDGGAELLGAHTLNSFNMRRPLNAGFYATRLALTQGSFWATMLIQAALMGVALYLLARSVAGRLGVGCSLLVVAVIFPFAQRYLDLTLTESLGLTLGCLGLALLLEGVWDDSPMRVAVGLLVLTVGLDVRAGAFLVLPALLVWVAVTTLRRRPRHWSPLGLAVAAVVVGLLLPFPLNYLFGSGGGQFQGNFSSSLYGLAHGGTGWQSAYAALAAKHTGSEADLTSAIYRAAFSEIRAHPGHLLVGIEHAYRGFFTGVGQGLFGVVYDATPRWMNRLLSVAMMVGWVGLLAQRELRRLGFGLATAWLGILLSVPFIYPDGGERVFAATVPFMAIPPAIGFLTLLNVRFTKARRPVVPAEVFQGVAGGTRGAVAIALSLICVLVVGPPVVVALHPKRIFATPVCAAGEIPLVVDAGPQTAHLTITDAASIGNGFGVLTIDQFHVDPAYFQNEIAPAFNDIAAGSVVLATYNLLAAQDKRSPPNVIVVMPIDQFPKTGRRVALCGRRSPYAPAAPYGVVFTDRLMSAR